MQRPWSRHSCLCRNRTCSTALARACSGRSACVLGHRSMDVPKKVPLMAMVLVLQGFLKQGIASSFRSEKRQWKGSIQRPKFLEWSSVVLQCQYLCHTFGHFLNVSASTNYLLSVCAGPYIANGEYLWEGKIFIAGATIWQWFQLVVKHVLC